MKNIAIQGILGSYHHQVVLEYYKKEHIRLQECMSFDILAQFLFDGKVDEAVMAIENTIAGSILPNYAIIDDYNFSIIGESYSSINHHLLALSGQRIEDLNEVRSHPMALLQCKKFLKKHPHIKRIETVDTATEAKRISDYKMKGVAAISSDVASKMYDLEKIEESIQTTKNNTTRFVILTKKNENLEEDRLKDKASLRFVLEHKRGNLSTILNVMSDCNLNLTKIQSLPIIEKHWKYAFFVDVTFQAYEDFNKAKNVLAIMTEELKVLGEYKNRRP